MATAPTKPRADADERDGMVRVGSWVVSWGAIRTGVEDVVEVEPGPRPW